MRNEANLIDLLVRKLGGYPNVEARWDDPASVFGGAADGLLGVGKEIPSLLLEIRRQFGMAQELGGIGRPLLTGGKIALLGEGHLLQDPLSHLGWEGPIF